MKEAAASKTGGVTPLEDGPITVFKDILDNAYHVRELKAGPEHGPYGFSPLNRGLRNLMIDSIQAVEPGQRISISSIEGFHPCLNNLSRSHVFSKALPAGQPASAAGETARAGTDGLAQAHRLGSGCATVRSDVWISLCRGHRISHLGKCLSISRNR